MCDVNDRTTAYTGGLWNLETLRKNVACGAEEFTTNLDCILVSCHKLILVQEALRLCCCHAGLHLQRDLHTQHRHCSFTVLLRSLVGLSPTSIGNWRPFIPCPTISIAEMLCSIAVWCYHTALCPCPGKAVKWLVSPGTYFQQGQLSYMFEQRHTKCFYPVS